METIIGSNAICFPAFDLRRMRACVIDQKERRRRKGIKWVYGAINDKDGGDDGQALFLA
jgi:hypothetical protein